MKIHFNSIGIITNVQTDEDSLRQGSVGTVLETTFEGINNNYYSAKLNFTRSDGTSISNVAMLWDSEDTETFKFVFYDAWFFALSGATTITVFLYDSKGKVIANGQYRFYIEPTDYNEEITITINQFNALMTALAGKVGIPTTSVLVNELPEKGESGVFYVVREGGNKTNIYVYNANIEDYVWVGTNDLNLGNYTTKVEQAIFEAGINDDIEQIRGEVTNPFVTVDSTTDLPSTNQNKLYIVKDANAWYYWNGTAYVEGNNVIPSKASEVSYDDEYTRLEAENVQEAIEKLAEKDSNLERQVSEKLDKNGYSALAHVGLADNIASPDGITQDTNISFSPTGGTASITDGFAEIKEIKGLTLVVNQLVKNGNFATSDEWKIITTDATATWGTNKLTITTTKTGGDWTQIYQYINGLRLNDKYYLKIKHTKSSNCALRLRYPQFLTLNDNSEYIITADTVSEGSLFFQVQSTDGQEATLELTEIRFVNLTKMFGAGKEPATIVEFNNLTRSIDIDTYNEGTLLSSRPNTLISTFFNAFDGELLDGYIDTNGILVPEQNGSKSSANFIPVVCGEEYTFTVDKTTSLKYIIQYDKHQKVISKNAVSTNNPVLKLNDNTYYCRIQFKTEPYDETAKACFHLTHSGYRNGQFEPYVKNIFKLPEGVLNEPLRSAGEAYDSWLKGQVIRRIGEVDLGTLDWTYSDVYKYFAAQISDIAVPVSASSLGNYLIAGYTNGIQNDVHTDISKDKTFFVTATKYIGIRDLRYTDVATFKASLSGVILDYELAEPIITEYTDEESWDISVSDFGTLQAVSVGRNLQLGRYVIFYMNNLRDFVRGIGNREDIDWKPENFVSQAQLQAENVIREQLKEALGGTLRQVLASTKNIDFNKTAWVDLGTLNWQYQTDRYFYATFNGAKAGTDNLGCDIVCSKYSKKEATEIYNGTVDKAIVLNAPFTGQNKIVIRDTAYTDTATFKQSLANVILAYEISEE